MNVSVFLALMAWSGVGVAIVALVAAVFGVMSLIEKRQGEKRVAAYRERIRKSGGAA